MVRLLRLAVLIASGAIAACASGSGAPDFTLRDDHGAPWRLAQQSKAVLLTFGFTRCADTCPATLAKLARVTRSLGTRSNHVEIAFVTVDPRHDTAPIIHRFLGRFDASGETLVGLTGTPAEIAAVERAYHVWARNGVHTAVIFLIDERHRMRGVRDDDESDRSLERAVSEMLG
ncbi:MAG: SCO family protein [Candidatus Baltobacteraceae bacterium]